MSSTLSTPTARSEKKHYEEGESVRERKGEKERESERERKTHVNTIKKEIQWYILPTAIQLVLESPNIAMTPILP